MLNKYSSVAVVLLTFSLNLNAQQNNPKLHQLFEQYYKDANVLSPLSATFNGVEGYNDQLPADDVAQLQKIHSMPITILNCRVFLKIL